MPPVAPLAGLAALVVYLFTMNRTFGAVDAGELAACAVTLGIPHPTGYPLLMLIGRVVTGFAPLRPVLTLNVLAALLTAGGVGLLAPLYAWILDAVAEPNTRTPTAGDAGVRRWIAGLAALATGLTGAWWAQGVGFEVYALQALLLPLVMLLFLRFVDAEAASEAGAAAGVARGITLTRRGAAFAFGLGAAFTNHVTVALLAPGLLIYYALTLRAAAPAGRGGGVWPRAFGRCLSLVPPFLLALAFPYLALMIRAGRQPRFDWGEPSTPGALLVHFTARDYQHALGGPFGTPFREQAAYFSHWLPGAVGYLGVPLALIGLFLMVRRVPRLAAWSGLVVAGVVVFTCNYQVIDVENYWLPVLLVCGAWSAVAAQWLAERFGRSAGIGVAAVLVLAVGAANYRANNQSANRLTENCARDMLETLPRGAIVFTRQWDIWESGSLYLQAVEHVREDVVVIDADLLNSPWYVAQLGRAHPDVFGPVRSEASRLTAVAHRLDRPADRTPDNLRAFLVAYDELVNALIATNEAAHPAYLTWDRFGPEFAPDYARIPDCLAQRLTRDAGYLAVEFPRYRFKMENLRPEPQTIRTLSLYAEAAQNRARYEQATGHSEAARRYAALVPTFDPHLDPGRVPDLPLNLEVEAAAILRRFEQARAESSQGSYSEW